MLRCVDLCLKLVDTLCCFERRVSRFDHFACLSLRLSQYWRRAYPLYQYFATVVIIVIAFAGVTLATVLIFKVFAFATLKLYLLPSFCRSCHGCFAFHVGVGQLLMQYALCFVLLPNFCAVPIFAIL